MQTGEADIGTSMARRHQNIHKLAAAHPHSVPGDSGKACHRDPAARIQESGHRSLAVAEHAVPIRIDARAVPLATARQLESGTEWPCPSSSKKWLDDER